MTFTDRELEVLEAVRAGARTYPHIAGALEPSVSRFTARMHVQNIATKLRELPEYAREEPLIAVLIYALSTHETPEGDPDDAPPLLPP